MDENKIKQRIIGAIVLVSLAVIFIPMILSGNRDQTMPLFGSPVPKKPDNVANIKILEFENVPQPPAERERVRSPVEQPDNSEPETRPASKSPEPAKPAEATEPAAETRSKVAASTSSSSKDKPVSAWAVQVGSFGNSSNALKLKEKLIKKGYQAFVEKISLSGDTTYRVRLGPEVNRDDAEKLQQQLERKMNIKGMVVSHP